MAEHPVRQTGEDTADPESWSVHFEPKPAEDPMKKQPKKKGK